MKASEKVGGYSLLTLIVPRAVNRNAQTALFGCKAQRRINCPVFSVLRPDVQAPYSQYRPAIHRGLPACESAYLTRNRQLMTLPSRLLAQDCGTAACLCIIRLSKVTPWNSLQYIGGMRLASSKRRLRHCSPSTFVPMIQIQR